MPLGIRMSIGALIVIVALTIGIGAYCWAAPTRETARRPQNVPAGTTGGQAVPSEGTGLGNNGSAGGVAPQSGAGGGTPGSAGRAPDTAGGGQANGGGSSTAGGRGSGGGGS